MNKINLRVFAVTLLSVVLLNVADVFAGTAYTNGRAFLKQGSPAAGGKVYVASNATEPTSGQYKAVTSSTSPAFNVQVAGDATFHYWAVANPGYIFTGWYTAEGALQSSGAAHISKKVTAGQAGGSDTHAYADFYASFIKQIQLSFVVPTNGSFTITHCGSTVTPAYSSFTTEGKVVLTALPADGYKLRGWYTTTNGGVTKNYFAFGPSCEPNFTSNVTIGAEFVPDDGKATFWIKGTNQIYDNLTSANTAAASSSSKLIVVVSDGVVGAGTYTISSGVTLLIPYEETYNLMTTPNIKHIPSPNAASKVTSIFRKLTLASGATINVSGNICIGGSIASCNGGSPSSFPTGSVGMLDLSRGGTINLASGSNLYAWGYVKGQDMDQGNNTAASGVGEINAASGATVWEDYQVGEWRGGTASSTIYNNKGSWKFFPFQSYSVQNIEAPVNYASGSSCKCYWTIFGNGSVYDVKFPLIASSGSLFKLASGGTVRKWYDPTTDHVCFEMGGTAALDALTLTVMGESVSSSDYYLPIPANLKIILKSGNTLTVSKPMTMHAGSVVEVKSGARLNVNSKVFLYDADDWDTYCMYAYYYRTYYSPSLHFNRGDGTSKTNLEDATVIVDGTVSVGAQNLYATAHGANICGNGGGTFIYSTLPSNTTMTQCKVLKDNVSVNIRSANLHNDNDTYTKGIASTTFKNVNGRWFTNAASTIKANKTYDFTYISSGDVYGTGGTNKTVAACWSKDKTGLELQDKWANIKTQGCTDWWEGIDDGHLYNWSRNSAWHQYIKTGSTTTGSGEEAVTTDTYVGSDGKMLYKTDCEFVDAGSIDGNCLYPSNKALVNGSLISVTANTSPDHGYHKSDAASTYYLCFEGCVWHPATRNDENLYTVDGTKYIWYGDKWMAVEYDSGVSLHYSLSATNVKIYYEYVNHAWVLATPVAEVVTSAGTEQVFSLANAITKAKAGGTNVTIRLLKNISGTISYDGTNNCGLDLNGFTLSSSTSGMITVNSATATFIIKDQSAAGTGKVQLSYSANARRYAISVTKGHLVVNSGTISATNTMAYNSSSAKTVDVGAITVANGHKVTVNGGSIEAISDHNPYGIYLAGATAMATINGGTIEAKTTERSSSVDSPYGIIGAGSIYVNGGTVKATCYRSSSSRGISSSGTFTMTGGSVIATASSTCYGVYADSGSNTTISGGTITSTTTGGTARALISYATATVSGGTLTATAGGSDAKGIYVAGGTTTVNTGATVSASATTNAYGIYYADGTPTVTVNNGTFTVSTTSTTGAYGVYAAKGTGTINDGIFTVTAKTTGAEGMHVETANTPKLTLNGGKFMVKKSDGAENGTINNTGATLANFSMAGGYFNIAPNGTANIASGKVVKDVDNVKEKAIYDAGYRKKIAGTEHTVTWKNYKGAVLATTMVEDGKLPVWSGANPTYTAGDDNYVFQGWAYSAQQRAGVALTAVTADVDIYAAYINMQAELVANGTTTQYEWAHSALIAARAYKQATVRLLAHCGNNIRVHDYVPTVANAITTLDLNGHTWECLTVQNDEDYFLKVNKSDAKLIITDNSGTGAGKLSYRRDKAGHIYGFRVQSGELVLQGGTLECIHTGASNYQAIGVSIGGTSAKLTMTGGTIEVAKTASSTGGSTSGIYAYGPVDITGGRIYVHNEKNAANGIYTFNGANGTVNVGGDVTVDVVAKNNAYGTYGYGTINVDGGTFNVSTTNGSNAVGFFPCKGSGGNGSVTVDGNPTVNVSTTSGTYAYGVKLINVTQWVSSSDTNHPYDADGVTATINSGTFTITSASSSASAIFNHKGGEVTVNGGTFNVKTSGGTCSAVEADYGSTTTINDGTFTVGTTTNAETSYWNVQALHVYQHDNPTVNINGGHFAVTNSSATTSAYFIRAFGGYINMKGDDINVSAYSLIYNNNTYYDNDTCFISIDGGEYTTTSLGIEARRFVNAEDATKATDMEVTIWDGKFKSINSEVFTTNTTNMPVKNLKLRGGYFSKKSMSKATFDNYVVSPSTSEELTSGTEFNAGYKYHVTTKYNVTWSVGGVNTVQEYNRNETPSYGSTPVYPGTTDTYEFTGWDQEIVPVTGDITYTAQFQKWEAEVYEGENPTPIRFAYFTDAFREAQELPVARIRVLSNVYYSTSLTLNPTETAGSKPLTIDLNNHVVNYTPKTATYALTINKAGCKLIIDDSSVAKGGEFGHRQAANNGALINAIYLQNGELELAGGTIIAQNNNIDASTDNSKGTRAVVGNSGTVFTQTGGKLYAKSRFDARAFNSGGNCTFNATGGTIEATTEYEDSGTKWGNNAYGVVLWNYGTFNMGGTATMNVTAATGALGVYPYGAGGTGYPEVNISGGSITCLTKSGGTARGIQTYGARATTNISGGDITANGPAGQYNIEDVTSQDDATVNITGGNFHSSTGANCVGVRVFSGTVTIGGTAFFDSRHGVVVGDWATSPTSTATAYVNGGTFDCSEYVLFAKETTNEYDSKNHYSGTVTGTMYVNGGYFKTKSGNNICSTSSQTGRLILHGGYYNETSGTTQKSNITTYKSATTEVSTLSPAITVDGRTYHYQLLTDFNITWLGGDSYSKVTTLKSGTMPTNTDLDGKCFLRNDSAFYFTGWNPTPVGVTGDATYNAEGVYHEASVKVGSAAPIIYDDFDEAWAYAMEQASATITLLTNLTRTSSIVYNPAPANARHTFNLNNFTIKENTTDRLLVVNKSDAKLTITDNSSAKGGCLYKKMNSSANMYTTIIYHGEMILAGGKIYVENTKDDKAWHPALAVHTSVSTDGIFTMTGGTVESQAKYLAYPIYNYATTNISGGTVIANATSGGAALGLYALAGTATISGGTFNVTASTNATGAIATGWINNDGSITENGVLNITGGTFNVSPTTNNARAIQATGTGKNIGGTIYTAHGIANISGGTFNVACPPVAAATQIFGAVVDGWRLFDGALPHTMIGESRGEMNISGGTFTIDARDNGTWVANSGNVDLLRSWGTLNVSGGNFTLHQYSTPSAISVFRGKTTVSGNPVFNVYAHTGNAYAVCAGYWTSENYCDKDAANNLAEAEVNGGTFKIITEGQNTNVIYSLGQISAESRDGETITAHAGYAMNAKVTVNGGEFLGICPNASSRYPIMLNSRVDQVGTYGTAKSEIYVTGGKFKSRKGTEADNTSTGAVNCHNNVGTLLLTGGYYETSGQLNAQKADTCIVTNITSAAIDPEYNNGYRYRIDVHYVAQVTATGVDCKFATLKGALDYAKTLANSTVTLLNDCNFETDGIYGYALGATGKTMTIDLNNHTVNATNSVTSYDRVFGASGQITVTDNSVAKGGKLNLTKNHNGTFIGIVLNDACQLTLANGTIYVENEMASKSATAINIWGTTGIFRQTGGTLQVKATSGLAEGIHMRGTANISGGNVIATSVGNNARAFAQDADAANSKYSSLTVSGTPTITVSGAGEVSGVYSNIANTSATISGGTWNISSTSSGAHGVRLSKASASASISGGTFNVTTTTTSAYCVYASTSASATVTGGTYNATATTMSAYGIYVSNGASGTVSGGTFTSRNGAGQNECFGAFATGTGTTLDITGGTFDVNSADNAGGNINVVRVQPGATVTISGGTFRSAATGGNALVSFGGVTTVSGTALFEAQTGAYVGSWYQGDGTNDELATVNLNGGTFNVTGIAINATWNTKYENKVYLDSPFSNSIVNVNGGHYKTTGGTIVQKKANGADGGAAVLNIAGGYFNEKSGTTHKDQIANFVSNPYEVFTLETGDPEIANGYSYEVCEKRTVKVEAGGVRTYYTNLNAAFEYAKTKANPTITLIKNADYTGPYTLTPTVANWRGTLDLNNFTITSNQSASFADRYFTLSKNDMKLTVTDNSGAKGGVWNMVGAGKTYSGKTYNYTIGIVVGLGELELAGGKIYVENDNASQSVTAINTWCSTKDQAFYTQTGGVLEAKSAQSATTITVYGATTISGGEVKATTTTGATARAFQLASHDGIIGALTVSGNPTITVNSATTSAYGIYSGTAGTTATVSGGTFNITSGTSSAYGISSERANTATISGGTFNVTATTSSALGVYSLSGNTTNVSGGTINATTASGSTRPVQVGNNGTVNITGGTFTGTQTGDGYNKDLVAIEKGTGTVNISGGTFQGKTAGFNGIRAFGGTTTISGSASFEAATGVSAADWCNDTGSETWTATVTINDGTFQTTGVVISASWDTGTAGNVVTSNVTLNGGKFKSTGSTIVTKKADGAASSTLTINGGYFNEKSGTTFRGQIANYVGSGKEVIDLETDDAEYVAGYRYKVMENPVVKVKVGSTTTYYTTVAAAITEANGLTNPTVTMLKNASTTQVTITAAMTIDLNGKTISSTQTTNNKGVFEINASGKTITITDSGTGGKIDHTATIQGNIFGIKLTTGTLDLQGGTIYAKNETAESSSYAVGIYATGTTAINMSDGTVWSDSPNYGYSFGIISPKTCTLTMTGGNVKATGGTTVRGLQVNGTATFTNATVTATATGDKCSAMIINDASGNVTINSGTYTASGPSNVNTIYQAKAATTTIKGGKFSGSNKEIYPAAGTMTISGGYYVHETNLEANCAANHHVLPASLTEGGITYNFEVAQAYTLTWNLDGGSISVEGTPAGYVKKGATVTAPTVTKTGYTFAGWTPAVAATMPAANTTYTATWTINSYDVTFNLQGHGSAIAKQTINYNGLVSEPATPTEANYVFGGWYKEAGCTNAWNFSTDHVTAATTLYAKWTDAVASVMIGGGDPAYYATVASAFTAVNAATSASTITMLKDATATSYLHYTGFQNCTLDLNGHTISYNGTTTEHRLLRINHADITFTVTDNSVGKEGKLLFNTSKAATSYGVVVIAGNFQLDAGTIEMHASGGTAEGVTPYNSGTSVTINGGKVHVVTTNSKPGYGAYSKQGTTTINGGTIQVEAAGAGYGIYYSAGITTVTDGKFNISGSTAYATNLSAANANMIIQGGWYNTNTYLKPNTPYHVFDLAGESPYLYEVAEGYTLTWTTDGDPLTGSYTSGLTKPGTTITAPNTPTKTGYTFASWTPAVAATMPAANTTYTAQWAVATVTINGVTTPYSDINDAWTAVTSATAASTLKLLQDISTSSTEAKMLYENAQNCTLDLNGHTLSMTNTASQSPLHIKRAGITFTITDGTVDKSGKLSMTSSSTSTIFGAYAENGNLVLEAGTIEVISGTKTTCGVTALTTGTFTMNGGTIHVVTTNGQEGRGLYFNGTMTVNSGTIHVEAAGNGYGIYRDGSGGTATVNGGKFKVTSSSGTPYITNQTNNTYVKIYGGYYNINSRLGTCVSAPKYVFRTTAADKASVGEDYEYKVTTGYVITYNKGANGTGTIASGTKAHGDDFTLSSSTFTRTGYTQTGWSESDGGAKAYELGGTYAENADITLYPFWSAQNYTLTLNNQSATTAGTTSITVTYNSNTNLTATPAITVPTKTGYTFGGYYVDQGGSGKQVIAANGNVNASVSGITDASKNWIAATGGTIYAKWTQTVTLHDNNGGNHNGSLEVTYNATTKSGTPPTREGYTVEGYYAEPACTNKVLTTAAVWVNYSGYVEGGKWVHNGESTLYTKWIETTHTVTVAAGANGSASPASVSGVGITTASGDITATPNTGYHFVNWTLPDGVTAASTYTASSNPIRINATADDKTITANFAVNSYDVTLNTNGGTINAGNVTSYTYGVGATLPTDVTKAGYTFAGWFDNSELTGSAVTTISTTATGDKEYWAKWTVALLRFTGATNSQWGNSSNWDPACVPTAAHDVYIQKPCSVDIGHAVAKSIVLDQSDSHTGSLTIGANMGLEVVGTISRTTTGEDNLPTRTEDLVLETSTTGNASLIFNNSNSNAATVNLYSKGYIDGSGTKNYQYIGVPVNEASALYNFYGSWMYSWGIKNGSWGWVSVKNGASVYPWTGYCITQQERTYYAIEGTLVPTTTKDITVPADENMVVGNSWTAPIDINALTTDDLEGLLANIYFFNTGVDKAGSGSEAEARYAGGTYVTVPIHAAPYKDGDDHINSMQGFFVKNTDKSNEGTLHLNYERHVRGTTRGSIIGDALHAPKHAQAEEPVVLKIKVSGENYDDKLLLLEREDFSTGFDNGWDGDKWDGNESSLYLYTKDSEGTENSVSAIPEMEGTIIGFRAGEDDGYTLYFDYLNSDETLYLYDTETHTYTRIETGATYWFMTYDKEKHERFIITRSDEQQITTGVGNVEGNDGQGAKARKLIIEDKMFIMVDGKLFDATGKMVK